LGERERGFRRGGKAIGETSAVTREKKREFNLIRTRIDP